MRIISIVGARPQFIKAATVAHAVAHATVAIDHRIVHTGQHYDDNMSQVFFDELDIPEPEVNLAVGSGPHGEQTGRMLERLEGHLWSARPDWVLVYGDTNTTLAGALAASKLNLRLAHVEAGLRSGDRSMPEEINRIVADAVSALLLCPTMTAVSNLRREGYSNIVGGGDLVEVVEDSVVPWIGRAPLVVNVGDVMFDAIQLFTCRAPLVDQIRLRLGLDNEPYALVTIHRSQNTDDLERATTLAPAIAALTRDFSVVFPIHPRTRAALERFGLLGDLIRAGVRVVEPLSYLEMLAAERDAHVIVTDSGGVQKEAYCLGVPCVTLRTSTEWVETLEGGWNRLAEPDPAQLPGIVSAAARMRADGSARTSYGRGTAAQAIVDVLRTLA